MHRSACAPPPIAVACRAALLLGLLGAAGCAFTPEPRELVVAADRPGAGTTAPASLSGTDVWRVVTDSAIRLGYRPAEVEQTLARKHYRSRWRTQVAGFGHTRRTRLDVTVVPLEDTASWRISYWIEQQVVRDIARSMDPHEDDWEAAGQDPTTERIYEGHLRVGLGLVLQPEQGDPARDPTLRRDPYKDG